ncbi:MAG TPA: PDZ domain-containing protein [Bryobacteraceae bacterium]|nr:PDZ domain-containing protein [Bryobacteraceae bacterium]
MRLIIAILSAAALCAGAEPLLLQKPTLNRTHIVFAYAGDLWTVPRDGGDAVRLTSGAGNETDPAFSPDGSRIAFTGEYDGNVDVFVMPASGGVPKRLTWHPAPDRVLGWTADGKNIIFASIRSAYSRYAEMFTVPADGGVEEKLPLPTGYGASMSADGQSIAYEPVLRSFGMWKDYRGGATSRVWLARLSDSSVTPVPRINSNDFNPIWAGDRIYFLSDRNGPATLFYYETRTKAVKEAIPNKGLDLKSASLGPDAIVYEQFGGISLYDLKTGKTRAVPIRVQGDFTELRAKFVNVGRTLSSPAISPNGARAVFTARGEVITVPAEKGDARDITNSPGVMERDPQWSPDGRFVAYLSDESGEYALHVHPQNGSGEVKKIALKPGFYRLPRFSPDSKKVALIDSFQKLWYVDIETGKQVEVAKDTYQMRAGDISGEWSPDSKWLAYSKVLPNELSAIHLYSLMDEKSTQVTDGLSDATNPVFDKDGKYLFFTASTNSGESLGLDIHAVAATATSSIYLAVLDKTQPSPFAPESDEEKAAEEKSEAAGDAKGDGKGGGTKSGAQAADKPSDDAKPKAEAPQVKDIKVDLDGIDQRILSVPMPPRRYMALQVGKAGTLLAIEVPAPAENAVGPAGLTIHRYDFKTRKSDVALSGVTGFQMSFGGEKALYRQGDNWIIAALRPPANGQGAAPPAPPPAGGGNSQGTLKTSDIQVQVDPVQEWRQMYREAWRIERDWFYDRNIHGLDVKAAEKKYEPYLNGIASRSDLTYLFTEMLGNMEVSHMGTGGGDTPEVKRVQTGLLGCDYEVANGRYRFARVYSGENWNPQMQAPLTQPGVNVKAGEYLLEVNGREVRPPANVYSFFEALAGKSVVLKVGTDASGAGAREVTVVPVPDETGLRNLAWIEENRRKVDQLSGGKVAYIYMPDTANGGLTSFNRYFYAQIGKDAAIVDERFNGGGLLATDIAEILSRKPLSAASNRVGDPLLQPQGIFGPKVMLINERAGSGGDAMPWYFKRAGVGKLIGTRTWGGLVGANGAPPLMDGGFVAAPSSGIYNPITGEWEVENIGVAPDIEVVQDPALVRTGHDPQLEKAVEVVMEELKKNPPLKLRRPAFPNHYPAAAK